MDKKLVGIREVAEYLGISVNTLYSWVWQGKIGCYKLGRRVKFSLNEIEQFLQKHKREPNPKWEVVDGDIPKG